MTDAPLGNDADVHNTDPTDRSVYRGRYPHVALWSPEVLRAISSGTLILKIYLLGPLMLGLIVGAIAGGLASAAPQHVSTFMGPLMVGGGLIQIVAVVLILKGVWGVTSGFAGGAGAPLDSPQRALRIVSLVIIAIGVLGSAVSIAQLIVVGIP
ncbi:MAG: hypothetical protein AAGI53_16425 [Planctomycetota bacterium]